MIFTISGIICLTNNILQIREKFSCSIKGIEKKRKKLHHLKLSDVLTQSSFDVFEVFMSRVSHKREKKKARVVSPMMEREKE